MMKRVLIFLLLLLAGQALAKSVECDDHSLRINLMPGEVGQTLTQDNFHGLPAAFMAMVDSANANQCRIVVEVSNDPTKWKTLRLMAQDPRYKGVNFETMNLVFDGALNVARRQAADQFLNWIGVSSDAIIDYRPMRDDEKCFIKVYSAPLLSYQQPRIVERIVEKPMASNNSSSNFQMPKLPKFGLAVHLGATSTIDGNVAPMGTVSLRIDGSLVQAYGFHTLFFPREEDFLEKDSDVYDQGIGLLVGKQLSQKIWLIAGYQRQEIVLDDQSDQSGKNILWFQGGEGGLMLRGDDYFVTLTGLYGHKKVWSQTWDQTLETDMGARLAVGIRFKGGK
jgi:hypothetical protein